MNALTDKHVLMVLGVGRSGTSAITRGLKVLGIDLGTLLRPPAKTNPKGFFEDSDILRLNRTLGRDFNDPLFCLTQLQMNEIETERIFSTYRPLAKAILQKRLATTDYWAFKDPRAVILLPFWQSVFKQNEIHDHYVLTVRNPLASAYSNHAFNQHNIEMMLLMWLVNNIALIDCTRGKNRVMVSFENMLVSPQKELKRLHHALSLPFDFNEQEANTYANEFLDMRLTHHQYDEHALQTHSAILMMPLCLRVYSLFTKLANDTIAFDNTAFTNEWHEIKMEFKSFQGIFQFIHTLHQHNQHLQRALRTIYKSTPWMLTKPLWWLNDKLRARKKKLKKQQRFVHLTIDV